MRGELNKMRATLACQMTYDCNASVFKVPFKSKNRKPMKLNFVYNIVNLS